MAEQTKNAFAEIVTRSWSDQDFHAKLVADPKSTLIENGVDVPTGRRVVLVEDSDDVMHLVLPARPAELSEDQLDSVAGGWWFPPPSAYTPTKP